jgi:bifunctional non-homologous end joining protein LigD
MLVAKPPSGPGWTHEVKHDGFRLLARKEGERVTLWTRHGTNFTDRLPRVAEAVGKLSVEQALLDGEAVVLRPDGHSDFEALRTNAGATRASYVAFDLLELDGKDFRRQPIEDRRAELERIVKGADAILFSESIAAEGALVFRKACEMAWRASSQSASAASIGAASAETGRRRGTRCSSENRRPKTSV